MELTDRDNVELLLCRLTEYKEASLNQELRPCNTHKNKRLDAAKALDSVEKALKKKGYDPNKWRGKDTPQTNLF